MLCEYFVFALWDNSWSWCSVENGWKNGSYDIGKMFGFVMLGIVTIPHCIFNAGMVAFNGGPFRGYNIAFEALTNIYMSKVVRSDFGRIPGSIDNLML